MEDNKPSRLLWCFIGMVGGTYLFKEMGVDILQMTIDFLHGAFTYIQSNTPAE